MYQIDWNIEELTPHQKVIADFVQKIWTAYFI